MTTEEHRAAGWRGRASPIAATEYAARRAALSERAAAAGAGVQVWWASHRIFYLCEFAFAPTERPIGLVVGPDGEALLFVPRLELEHAEAYAHVDRVVTYAEYPGQVHPMQVLADELRTMLPAGGRGGAFAGDGDGYAPVMGYRGPRLSDLVGTRFMPLDEAIEDAMMVKSPAEVALIRESAYWAGRAHRLLQDHTRVGRNESEVEIAASASAAAELEAAYQGTFRALSFGRTGPFALYRGQVGVHSALPHSLTINAVFQPGDTLVTGASSPMFGYWSELERTMVIGEPSTEQRRFFGHMLELQTLAIDACRAGRPCDSVDRAVRAYFAANDLEPYWRHHVGHNVGIRYHEGPFLDIGDDTIMEPGMLFTVEPGVYVPGLGGFRHSDTILVTDGDPEYLTDYPRDLESLVLPLD